MNNYGALGRGNNSLGLGESFQDAALATALSTANTIVLLNIASGVRLLPTSLYKFVARGIKRWWFDETQISIPEFGSNITAVSNIFSAAEIYIGTIACDTARQLRATADSSGTDITVSVDGSQVVTDTFSVGNEAIPIRWSFHTSPSQNEHEPPSKYHTLTFNSRHRSLVVEHYLSHVMAKGEKIMSHKRQLKLCTNQGGGWGAQGMLWNHVVFDHPATFDTFAMDPRKKREIMDDLATFSSNKGYYAKIGKAWKRGYLLYGPPGTGKSTMIACMANFLKYDVYDLELTAVPCNSYLRRLMVQIPGKSIIVMEDIDCSFDLMCNREGDHGPEPEPPVTKRRKTGSPSNGETDMKKINATTVLTLAGLLNFIDGLWSACCTERLVVFTTNHVDRLDPALIRKGRMDVQVELSYCQFEAFKVLAKNYLGVDEHRLFGKVRELLEAVEITPADVAEQLLPKNMVAENRAEECLGELIRTMQMVRDGKGSGSERRRKIRET